MYRVLLVEDDRTIAQTLSAQLSGWGFAVRAAENFQDIVGEFRAFDAQLVLLDLMLPFQSGFHWCAEIRKLSKAPIMFLSSASDNMNIVMAMNMGADDFIAKPFDCAVLVAKMQALLRRSYDFTAVEPALTCRGARLCTDDQTLLAGTEKIALTKNEYRILLCLMEQKGKVVSRERLMERLWESEDFVDENTLTVNVNRLRRKLGAAGLDGFITTKFGVGYLVEDV